MKIFSIIVTIAFVLTLAVVGLHRDDVLRFRDAVDLQVHRTPQRDRVIVTGGMTHSGLTVRRTTTAIADHTVIVRVYIEEIRGNNGIGSYAVPVNLPPNTERIWFGDAPHATSIGRFFGIPIRLPLRQPEGTGGVIWEHK